MTQATKTYKVDEEISFWVGDTPVSGTILHAMGPDAAAVRLNSGAEVVVPLSDIR